MDAIPVGRRMARCSITSRFAMAHSARGSSGSIRRPSVRWGRLVPSSTCTTRVSVRQREPRRPTTSEPAISTSPPPRPPATSGCLMIGATEIRRHAPRMPPLDHRGKLAPVARRQEGGEATELRLCVLSSYMHPPAPLKEFGALFLVDTVARHRETCLSTSRESNAHRDALRKSRRPPCLHADRRLMSLRLPRHAGVLRQGTGSRATSGCSDESCFASPCRDAPARPVPTPGGAGCSLSAEARSPHPPRRRGGAALLPGGGTRDRDRSPGRRRLAHPPRSEEHTSELQSHLNLVCRLLLEK